MSLEESAEQIVVPMHAARRGMGLEVVLTGAAIGLSIFTLMKMNTLEERVRALSRGDVMPKGKSCKLNRPNPPVAEKEIPNDGYETSDDEQEESDDDEEPPPPPTESSRVETEGEGEGDRIVEVNPTPKTRTTRRSDSTKK